VDEARGEIEDLLRLIPYDPRPHGALSEIHLARGDYDRALEESREAVRLDDHYAQGFDLMGFRVPEAGAPWRCRGCVQQGAGGGRR